LSRCGGFARGSSQDLLNWKEFCLKVQTETKCLSRWQQPIGWRDGQKDFLPKPIHVPKQTTSKQGRFSVPNKIKAMRGAQGEDLVAGCHLKF
jgi:hypothetical protein